MIISNDRSSLNKNVAAPRDRGKLLPPCRIDPVTVFIVFFVTEPSGRVDESDPAIIVHRRHRRREQNLVAISLYGCPGSRSNIVIEGLSSVNSIKGAPGKVLRMVFRTFWHPRASVSRSDHRHRRPIRRPETEPAHSKPGNGSRGSPSRSSATALRPTPTSRMGNPSEGAPAHSMGQMPCDRRSLSLRTRRSGPSSVGRSSDENRSKSDRARWRAASKSWEAIIVVSR